MKTIICDIDGTITDMWPIEKSVLLRMVGSKYEKDIEQMKASGISDTYKIFRKCYKQKITRREYISLYNHSFDKLSEEGNLPDLERYAFAEWVYENRSKYRFIYATGGQRSETLYVLECLGIMRYFDIKNSIDKTVCRFSKKTGIPFRGIKSKFEDCMLVSDSVSDCRGAALSGIPTVLIRPNQKDLTHLVYEARI